MKYLFSPIQSPAETALVALDDVSLMSGLSMIVMALVAVAEWDALSLDARDTAILGPLPVSARDLALAQLDGAAAVRVRVRAHGERRAFAADAARAGLAARRGARRNPAPDRGPGRRHDPGRRVRVCRRRGPPRAAEGVRGRGLVQPRRRGRAGRARGPDRDRSAHAARDVQPRRIAVDPPGRHDTPGAARGLVCRPLRSARRHSARGHAPDRAAERCARVRRDPAVRAR